MLDLPASLTDGNGAASPAAVIRPLPDGGVPGAGYRNLDGGWTLAPAGLPGLQLTLPASLSGPYDVAVAAVSAEAPNQEPPTASQRLAQSEPAAAPRDEWSGVELWVGPGEQFATPQSAIAASHEGDTIYIRAGEYRNVEARISHSLRLIGVGSGPASLVWAGDTAKGGKHISNGKGILLSRPSVGHLYIENLSFTGATVRDRNGAGIRHHGKDLTVVNSSFIGNENGILAGKNPLSQVHIKGSTFDGNGFGDGRTHAIYITSDTLIVEDSTFLNTRIGHHVKSLATTTIVRGCVIDDADGTASYSVESSRGGDLLVEDNVITQSAAADNWDIFHYAVSRGGAGGVVIIRNNTIVNAHPKGILVDNDTASAVRIVNNTISNQANGALKMAQGLAEWEGNTLDGEPFADGWTFSGAVLAPEHGGELTGDDSDNLMLGLDGDDVIYGEGGPDTVAGGKGDDRLYGGNGEDVLYGGVGNDVVYGQADNDFLAGQEGDDLIVGGLAEDTIFGGAGDDVIIGGVGADRIDGEEGDDIAVYSSTFDQYKLRVSGGSVSIQLRGKAIDDGHDRVRNVEKLQFSDGMFDVSTEKFFMGAKYNKYRETITDAHFQ